MARDYQLLHTASDYFQFLTNFFEVINISATHIYHSALELSPLSSIVRKHYYHPQYHPSPRVVIGTRSSWEPVRAGSTKYPYYLSSTWSPCSQFVAVVAEGAVEIWDALTLKLLSTPHSTKSTDKFRHGLAYSPDGSSLAACSDTGIIIWDMQTGGEATRIETKVTNDIVQLVWSLDKREIATISQGEVDTFISHTYDVTSGVASSPGVFQSKSKPYIWAHDECFQIVVTIQDKGKQKVEILEVGQTLKKIKSLPFWFSSPFGAFSPTTYRASVSISGDYNQSPELTILDINNSEVLLKGTGSYWHHSFSPDATFFAAFTRNLLSIWKYSSGHYIQWREFQQSPVPLQFSPTSLSVLGHTGGHLYVLHLDYSPTAHATESVITPHRNPIDAFAPDKTYVITTYQGESTITITNLQSQHPFPAQFIDTELEISAMVLTGNVLLVRGSTTIVAWLLTEEGMVDGIVGNTRADRSDSFWDHNTPSQTPGAPWARLLGRNRVADDQKLEFLVVDEIATIKYGGWVINAYNTKTGELSEPARGPQSHRQTQYQFQAQHIDGCNQYHCDLFKSQEPLDHGWAVSQTSLQEGWVKDPEGRHRLWLHPRWRSVSNVNWLHNATTLRLKNSNELAIIKL